MSVTLESLLDIQCLSLFISDAFIALLPVNKLAGTAVIGIVIFALPSKL